MMVIAMSPDSCGDQLSALLEAQVGICQKILFLSEKQQKLVEERREDELLSLLNDKQRLIEEHQGLSAKALPLREQWQRDRERASPAVHAKVEKAWNQLREVMDTIVQLEDASRAMLQDHKGEVSLDLGKLQRGKIVNKAYGGGVRPPPQARFSDRQG